jgi:hypothetical protein
MAENEEDNNLYTGGGIQYELATSPAGEELKIRYDDAPGRLNSDGETFEEFKLRQAALKRFTKARKKGFLHWHGSWGPMTPKMKDKVKDYMQADQETKDKILAQAEGISNEALIGEQIKNNNEQVSK